LRRFFWTGSERITASEQLFFCFVRDNETSRQKELKMLVLSRQKDESIMIGDDVEVTIVDVRGDKVRLGITAPKSIPVHRMEVYQAIQREKSEKQV